MSTNYNVRDAEAVGLPDEQREAAEKLAEEYEKASVSVYMTTGNVDVTFDTDDVEDGKCALVSSVLTPDGYEFDSVSLHTGEEAQMMVTFSPVEEDDE